MRTLRAELWLPWLAVAVSAAVIGASVADASYTIGKRRNASDVRVRYHVNGSQYIDERVATFTDASGAFAYYLGSNNFSVTGTGNADGSVVQRLDYSSTGDFAGGGAGASAFYHDADDDLDIDLRDFANFQNCFDPTPPVVPACATVHDWDDSSTSDGTIDLDDYARFFECSRGPFVTPDSSCARPEMALGPIPSGTFALHGRAIDVLSDGFVLQDFRARTYLPQFGRSLQRDPLRYIDSRNLYEAFASNSLSRLDPHGQDSVESKGEFLEYTTDGFAWDFAKVIGNGLVLIDHPEWPFAFVMREQDALSQFNTGPFTDDYYSVFSIMAHATSLVTQAGSKSLIVGLFDKRASSLGWITPDELETEGLDEFRRLGAAGLQAQLAGVGNLTATAFTVTTGALAAPAGAGATLVDVGATAADVASGNVSIRSGALVLTAVAAGAALHLRFADEATAGAGGFARRSQQFGELAPNIRTGAGGRVESVFAKLEPHHLSAGTRTTAEARQLAANLGTASDDAGHIIGRTLGGRGGATSSNIIPQSPNVNRGEFRAFEDMIAQRVMAGDEVFVRIVPRYRGGETRPFEVLYQVRVNGKTTSKVFQNP